MSSIKAMTINGFLLARLEKKNCLIKPGRMVVMGGLVGVRVKFPGRDDEDN